MLITNFASGELSQNLNGRVDIQQYYQGAARIENFEIIPTGGIKRRPGTKRLSQLSGNSRIIPFIVDKNSVYVLEMAENPNYDPNVEGSPHALIKVWKRGALGNYSVIQTLNADYLSLAVMREVQYAQNYDTLILVHKDYKPIEIKRNGLGVFSAGEMDFNFIPEVELDDDYDFIMICSKGLPVQIEATEFSYYSIVNGTEQYITKSYPLTATDFYCISGGKLYKWDGTNWVTTIEETEIEEVFTSETKYPSCAAFFNNRLFFAGTRAKPQKVWASAAPDSKSTRYNDFAPYKKYVTVNKAVKEADLHTFTCDIDQADVSQGHTTLRNVSQDFTSGLLKDITDYYITGEGIPVGTKVISATEDTLVIDTDQIVFEVQGYTNFNNNPNPIGTGDSGSSGSDNSGSGSSGSGSSGSGNSGSSSIDNPVSGNVLDPNNTTVYKKIENLVCSIQLWKSSEVLSADDYDYIVAANNITTADCSLFFELASDQNDAIQFLSSNRFLAVGTESSIWSIDPGISALSINAMMQGRYGSDNLQGQAVETATVYFAQGRKGIREFYYDGESAAFRTNNIAILADHILRESAVIDFDYMTNPYSRLILVQNNGNIAQMLYDKTNGIMAWSRLTMTAGKIHSCAVTRGDDENDYVFLVVEDGEDENHNPLYYLELLDLGSNVYLDSWSEYAGVTTGYGIGAILYNETTDQTCPIDNIPAGFINENDVVYIGYKFTSYIKSMPVISGDPSKRIRISALLVRFLNSFKPVMKCTNMADEHFNSIQNVPYSGIAKMNYPGATDHDVCFELEADDVKPVNILSVDAQTA